MNILVLFIYLFLLGTVLYFLVLFVVRSETKELDARNTFNNEGGMLINGKYYIPLNTVFRIEQQGKNLFEDHVSQELLKFILHKDVIIHSCYSVYFIDVIHEIELQFK